MKITRVSAHIVGVPGPGGNAPSRNWIFVRIDTDTDLYGIGEATTEYHEHAVAAMIDHHFGPLLLGRDPTRIRHAWQLMQRTFWWRNGVVASSAISGIEQALWDLTGKAFGQPVYKLLGGTVRDCVRVYARGDLGLPSPIEELKAAIDEGFDAFKFGPSLSTKLFDEGKAVQEVIDIGRSLQSAAGDRVDLLVDCGGVFSLAAATRLIDGLSPLGVLFVEEPVNMDTPYELIALRSAFPNVAIAAGERQMTRWGFREWLEHQAVDVIQADLCHCGGLGELLRIASYAEIYNVQVAPHNPYGPIALAANVHACAVIPNFLILETCRLRPWFDEVQVNGLIISKGSVQLTDTPGLGVQLDWDYVAAHPYCPLVPKEMVDQWGGGPPAR